MPIANRHSVPAHALTSSRQTESAVDIAQIAPYSSIWLFPGLGCRYVGMGHDLFDQHPLADDLIAQAQDWLGYDIRAVCLEGSGRKVVPPRQEAQVIYVLNCAYAGVLREQGHQPLAVAGHSLGCWAAAFAAGLYDFQTGLELVTHVEELLEDHADGQGQGMGVIVGLDATHVQSLLVDVPDVTIANWNSQEQVVLGGNAARIDAILAEASRLGAKRAKTLPTTRALHTPVVGEVATRLRHRLSQVRWSEPAVPFLAGLAGPTGEEHLLWTSEQICGFLGEFLERPVYWQRTIENLRRKTSDPFTEVGPGNVLSQMLSFIDRNAVIRTASDLLEQDVDR